MLISRHRLARRAIPLVLAGTVALAACSQEDLAADPASPNTTESAAGGMGTAAPMPDTSGDPPDELEVETLAEAGDAGAATAQAGDVVAVHYTGRAWSTGEVFDSSSGRNPITFTLGVGQVIAGWDQGIAGLQVGQQARLIIPPDLAYGEAGAPPAIGPNETLVFDVELVEILQPAGATPSPDVTAE